MAEPPLCTVLELRTVLTIDDVADMNELLDLKESAAKWAEERSREKR